MFRLPRFRFLFFLIVAFASRAAAGGLYNPSDARAAALGGQETAQTGGVLSALDSNPAALATMSRAEAAITFTGALLRGEYQAAGETSHLRSTDGFVASGAVEVPAPNEWPVRVGLAVIPDLTLDSDWRYLDPPGGLGGNTSYGTQTHHSRLLSLRTTAAVAVSVTRWLSLGASGGFVYDENSLHAPYIFQSQPVLAGFKTLLDLQTEGFAPAFDFGLQLHPISVFTAGLSYRPRSVIDTTGRASGNASAQLQSLGGGFATVDPQFSYDAAVRTELPQRVAAGAEWQAVERLRLVAGVDWVDWSGAFDQLPIHLTHGSNPAINGVVGGDSLTDVAPLRWRDQFIYRAGLEFKALDALALRAGYSYGRSAVPNETLTPLTGAIFEHTVSAGVGYEWGSYHADFSWQWQLPATQRVGNSVLLDGESSDSSLTLSAHIFQLTTGVTF